MASLSRIAESLVLSFLQEWKGAIGIDILLKALEYLFNSAFAG